MLRIQTPPTPEKRIQTPPTSEKGDSPAPDLHPDVRQTLDVLRAARAERRAHEALNKDIAAA